MGSLIGKHVMEATSRKHLKCQDFQCAARSLFPSAGPSLGSWEDATWQSHSPQVPRGSRCSLQSLAKLAGQLGWLKSSMSCFLLIFLSRLHSLLMQAAPSCAEGSFRGVRKYEKKWETLDPLGKLWLSWGVWMCVIAVGGLNFGCLSRRLWISAWISKLLWEDFRLNEKWIP